MQVKAISSFELFLGDFENINMQIAFFVWRLNTQAYKKQFHFCVVLLDFGDAKTSSCIWAHDF